MTLEDFGKLPLLPTVGDLYYMYILGCDDIILRYINEWSPRYIKDTIGIFVEVMIRRGYYDIAGKILSKQDKRNPRSKYSYIDDVYLDYPLYATIEHLIISITGNGVVKLSTGWFLNVMDLSPLFDFLMTKF